MGEGRAFHLLWKIPCSLAVKDSFFMGEGPACSDPGYRVGSGCLGGFYMGSDLWKEGFMSPGGSPFSGGFSEISSYLGRNYIPGFLVFF